MAVSRKMIIKRGEDKTFRCTLTDYRKLPIDLTGWTITMYATAQGDSTHLIEAGVSILNQTTNTGQIDVSWAASATGTLTPAEYDLECKGLKPGGKIEKFPCVEGRPFGKFIVLDAK